MPQLNPLDWAPQLIWLVITFGILYVLMKRVALPRIGSVIEARHARIAGDIEAADKLRRETQKAIAAYEQLRARHWVPVEWGTFGFLNEKPTEAIATLDGLVQQKKLEGQTHRLAPGQTYEFARWQAPEMPPSN